ncbi:hypothetical protein [Pseudocitrobacter sp. RIT415]|nr:hypothetical protein [Pseudocitrobacter sp. RIT 415]
MIAFVFVKKDFAASRILDSAGMEMVVKRVKLHILTVEKENNTTGKQE